MNTTTVIDLNKHPGLGHKEALDLAQDVDSSLVAQLRSLDVDDWSRPTDCEGWDVRDIAAHLLGWAEAMTDTREFFTQSRAALKGMREHGNILHAQNAFQVERGRALAPEEIIRRLEAALPRMRKFRNRVGTVGRFVPMYYPVVGRATVRFLTDSIFTRDSFMHRIDISRAVGRELELTDADRRVTLDCVRGWAQQARPDARLELSGPGGFVAKAGSGQQVTIRADAIELLRLWAGRAELDVVEMEGDRVAGERWLAVGCPF